MRDRARSRPVPPRFLLLAGAALGACALLGAAPCRAQRFGPPFALNTNADSDIGFDAGPRIATDGAGHWVAVWSSDDPHGGSTGTDGDILFARSSDAGQSWSAPLALDPGAGSDQAVDAEPDLATDRAGTWIAAWNSSAGATGSDDDILFARSTDHGATWSAPAPLNSDAAGDALHDTAPRLAGDGQGNWVAVWYTRGGSDEDLRVARSLDDGVSWSAPAALNTNAASDSGDDESPRIASDGAGNWVAVWDSDDTLGGALGIDRDILVARSSDAGASWTDPAPLNGAASDFANDLAAEIASDGAGNWVAVWQSFDSLGNTIGLDADILVARSADQGATWSAPAALNSAAVNDAALDRDAEVVSDGVGNWVAIWSSTESSDSDIFFARSTDAGATWSAQRALDPNAASDTGHDASPQLAMDGAGRSLAVWASSDPLDGTLESDYDLLAAVASGPSLPALPPSALVALAALLLGVAVRGPLQRLASR